MTRRQQSRGHAYDPRCIACTAPARLAAWLADQQARADAYAAEAREIRTAAEEARKALLAFHPDSPSEWRQFADRQQEHIGMCALANVYALRAIEIHDHASRVEAAHPAPAGEVTAAQDALFDLAGGAS
ncbi:hypothetical protein [Streptosporangium sp. NPDC051022]|uniref:hypothetical protein n=1 Tax=Streptosporangium sp. NPDC051022 TaxID=3155752 RepID=UPI0034290A9E